MQTTLIFYLEKFGYLKAWKLTKHKYKTFEEFSNIVKELRKAYPNLTIKRHRIDRLKKYKKTYENLLNKN